LSWRETLKALSLETVDTSDRIRPSVTCVTATETSESHFPAPPTGSSSEDAELEKAIDQSTSKTSPASEAERWLPWDTWLAEQHSRIFAEASVQRELAVESSANGSIRSEGTPFQRAFYGRLTSIPAKSKVELLNLARAQGIPDDAIRAYCKCLMTDVGHDEKGGNESRSDPG
jgi:hypothetical protein